MTLPHLFDNRITNPGLINPFPVQNPVEPIWGNPSMPGFKAGSPEDLERLRQERLRRAREKGFGQQLDPSIFQQGPQVAPNPYLEVIEAESPRSVFEAFSPGNLMPGQRNAFSNLFTPTFSQFLGEEAKRFAGGNNQPYSFTQFLSNQFDPRRELLKQTASQTGQNTSRLTGGNARFLTF